jgi:transglutaminase-like putative cysteine protease
MGRPAWAEHVDWGRLARRLRAVADWRVMTLGAVLFAGVVGVSALLFLAIPRFQMDNSLFLERFIAKKARSGFNDSIKFGDVTEIQQDESVALSVDVSDPKAVPASPYWRMLVLDEYREGGFRLSPAMSRSGFARERTETGLRGEARARLGEPVFWTFYMEAGVSRYVPLLGRFEQLRFREVQTFRPSAELGVVMLRAEPATMTAYRVEGMRFEPALADPGFAERWRQRGEAPGSGGRGESLLQRRLALGADDRAALARVRAEMAGTGRSGATPPTTAEFGRAASNWLLRNHGYSLAPKIPKGEGDALVRWLTSTESGHCELFAGAMVLLARDAGMAARVVIGFKGGSWNGYSNNFTVRNSDAHAWAELWDEAQGAWLRVDPLAPGAGSVAGTGDARGEVAIAERIDRSWTARFDSLRVFWYRRIVNFDSRSQVETLQAVKAATEQSGKRARETLERAVAAVKAWIAGPWDVRRVVTVLGVVVAAFGVGWVVRNFRWANFDFRLGKGARRADPVRREAGRWLERLREGGEAKAPAEATAVRAELERLRYGPPATWPEPEAVFRRARDAVKARGRRVLTRP